jgi:hypothetical protein
MPKVIISKKKSAKIQADYFKLLNLLHLTLNDHSAASISSRRVRIKL